MSSLNERLLMMMQCCVRTACGNPCLCRIWPACLLADNLFRSSGDIRANWGSIHNNLHTVNK
jgi:hypothetical protein